MRLVAGDGEFGLIAFGVVPVGIVAFGVAPFGILAFGPCATGVVAGMIGAGWVRGFVGVLVGGGVVTAWRSYLCGGGLAIGGRSLCIGGALSVDAIESDGMSLPWEWHADKPSIASVLEWWRWKKRRRQNAYEMLSNGEDRGVVVADGVLSEARSQDEQLRSGGIVIEGAPEDALLSIARKQALGLPAEIEVEVSDRLERQGYRDVKRDVSVAFVQEVAGKRPRLGSFGFWLMVAFLVFVSLFVRVLPGGADTFAVEVGPMWAALPASPPTDTP